jgi:hypothetical protein
MKVNAAVLFLALLISCVSARAGEPGPAAPEAKPEHLGIAVPEVERGHRFFDLKNSLALSSFAVGLAGDALSTQKGLDRGHREINPIARPFVNSRAGTIVYSAGSFSLLAGGMYLAHKTGHHKLERIVPLGLAAWEGFLTYRNFHVSSGRRSSF